MGNTINADLVKLSRRIYKEWYAKTVLVQSCDNSYEGELNLQTRELDIPVYHDLSIHKTTIKERELKPAPIEFVKSSTKRVTIDKGRYSHWGETNIGKLVENLSAENSETRKKLINRWAQEAEEELGIWCAQLPASQEIDLITLLTDQSTNANGLLTASNVFKALDILKAHASAVNMTTSDFKLFISEKFLGILRDAKITLGSNLDANEAFRTGYVGHANDVEIREISIAKITTRNASTKLVDAEWAIWKTRDGIQYVVPYKNTISYEITPSEILLGGKGYQTVEYYDFFNLYPTRLYKIKIRYAGTANPPTSF
jgi:hypothetical protein